MKNFSQLLYAVVPGAVFSTAAFVTVVSFGGCDVAPPSDALHDDARADNAFRVFGSCSPNDCGGQASSGSCWCDDLCEGYGDCCDDKAPVCDAPAAIAEGEDCGDRIVGECADGLVCERSAGTCGTRDLWGTCQPQAGEICPAVYMPVCGCDGTTYSNDCQLGNGGLAYDGICNGDIGGMCGGIAGFACVEGSHCELEGDFPDAAGTCIEDAPEPGIGELDGFCGGIAAFQCNEGHCELMGNFPDAGGTCVADAPDSCSNHCGGQSEDVSCWCDDLCIGYGDCCDDLNTFCG